MFVPVFEIGERVIRVGRPPEIGSAAEWEGGGRGGRFQGGTAPTERRHMNTCAEMIWSLPLVHERVATIVIK